MTSLSLWDFWYEWRAGSTGAAASDYFGGVAVSSGTNTTAATPGATGFAHAGVFLRSSTSANGGYRYAPSVQTMMAFGTISRKFRGAFLWRTSFTDRTVRIGFHDANSSTDAVDGAYFEIIGSTCSAKTASNSTRTTNGTTVTLSLDVVYTFDVEVNAAGTSARFRVYENQNETPIMDVTNTSDIPTGTTRAFGPAIVATEASTTASDIGILYLLAFGTIEGFNRARGNLAPAIRQAQVVEQTATAYTLAESDDGLTRRNNNASAQTITLPLNSSVALPVGFTCNLMQFGAGTVTITAASGVTLNGVTAGSCTIQTRYRGLATVTKIGTNEWLIFGDVTAVA
jgi:hypothetical protein